MKRIAVGTQNPIKIEAVRMVAEQIWGKGVMVTGTAVSSGVPDMPHGDEVCITGARNRALAAQQVQNADFGIGLEGGVQELDSGLYLCGWVVVVSTDGREGIGSSGKIQLPEGIAVKIRDGAELGPVMDEVVQAKNTKQKMGAVGLLTSGLIDRKMAFGTAVTLAFAPFLTPHFYEKETL